MQKEKNLLKINKKKNLKNVLVSSSLIFLGTKKNGKKKQDIMLV